MNAQRRPLTKILLLCCLGPWMSSPLPGLAWGYVAQPQESGTVTAAAKQRLPAMTSTGLEATSFQSAICNLNFVFSGLSRIHPSTIVLLLMNDVGSEVARLTTQGPWVYLQLPPGNYRAWAIYQGKTIDIGKVYLPNRRGIARILYYSHRLTRP